LAYYQGRAQLKIEVSMMKKLPYIVNDMHLIDLTLQAHICSPNYYAPYSGTVIVLNNEATVVGAVAVHRLLIDVLLTSLWQGISRKTPRTATDALRATLTHPKSSSHSRLLLTKTYHFPFPNQTRSQSFNQKPHSLDLSLSHA
jgi:hypothetical protein